MEKQKVYISGPMTGLERSEYMLRFHRAEKLLRREGYWVVNPARFAPSRYPRLYKLMGYRLTLLYDLWRLMHCDLIYKMPGWRGSHGAQMESCVAFHCNLWPLPKHIRNKIDQKMTKYIEEREQVISAFIQVANEEKHAFSP